MNWSKLGVKGVLGIVTFIVAYIASNPQIVTSLIPENIAKLSVGGLVAGLLVSLANWLKHRADPKK